MPEMTGPARTFCTSVPYRFFARRVILPWAFQGISPEGRVLEIGAGSGAMSAGLLSRFPEVTLVATDYDLDMVTAARRTLAAWPERVTVQQADAAALPFAGGQFSLVMSCAMLHHVIRWEQALAEATRVLRPGGLLVGFDLLHVAPFRLLHGGHVRSGHHHHGAGGNGQDRGQGATRMLGPDDLERELGRLPLGDVRTRRSAGGLAVRFRCSKAG